MKGKTPFIIYLNNPTQANFVGVAAQASKPKSEFEVLPQQDEIHFSVEKKDIKIVYIRNYPDWPSSRSTFFLSEVADIQEVVDKKV